MSAFSYLNLSWRLEVEVLNRGTLSLSLFIFYTCCCCLLQLAKRSMQVVSEPRYLLRLDLANNSAGPAEITAGAVKHQSHHLQADHASMKLLEQELQRAVDEVNSVHCQRINRYMS